MLEREQIEDWRGRSGFVVTTFDDAMPGFLGLPRFFSDLSHPLFFEKVTVYAVCYTLSISMCEFSFGGVVVVHYSFALALSFGGTGRIRTKNP